MFCSSNLKCLTDALNIEDFPPEISLYQVSVVEKDECLTQTVFLHKRHKWLVLCRKRKEQHKGVEEVGCGKEGG